MNTNNVWELAEAYLAGTLTAAQDAELRSRRETDEVFAAEFNDSINLINSMNGAGKQKRFRNMLQDIHQQQAKPKRLISFTPTFWRTAAVAATVALVTSLINYSIIKGSSSDKDYTQISKQVNAIANNQKNLNKIVQDSLINKKPVAPPSDVRRTGTGVALTNDGYFVTAYHVINDGNGDGDSVYIQANDGVYYKAFMVNYNAESDLAILKVEKNNFQFNKGEVPYSFVGSKAALGAQVYTVGYPKEDIVYSEGYVSSRNGYRGNKNQYTLELPAGHGQSGSPLVDAHGNILGILTAIGKTGESNTYAVSSEELIDLIDHMPAGKKIKLPKGNKLGRMGREEQIARMEDYTFSVKVYKK
jgi:serine protease Do